MTQVVHNVELLDNSSQANPDRLIIGNFPDVATVVGGGAGVAVTKAFVFAKPIKAKYTVTVTPNQDADCYVTAKTAMGFTVTLYPRLAANTLAVGTIDILVVQ